VIERWLVAIRDHPERPPPMQCHVLTMLGLRMNWSTGTGYASTGQLVADSDANERTIRRATAWARSSELLLQTRRGHRLGNGQVAASEWKLTQPVTGDLLTSQPVNGQASTGQQGHLNRSPETHHQDLSSSLDLSPSSDLIKIVIEEIRNATGRTIGPQWAARTARFLLEGRGAANPAGYIRASIRGEPDPKMRFLSLYDNQDQA
jgi:hypothetical protein